MLQQHKKEKNNHWIMKVRFYHNASQRQGRWRNEGRGASCCCAGNDQDVTALCFQVIYSHNCHARCRPLFNHQNRALPSPRRPPHPLPPRGGGGCHASRTYCRTRSAKRRQKLLTALLPEKQTKARALKQLINACWRNFLFYFFFVK